MSAWEKDDLNPNQRTAGDTLVFQLAKRGPSGKTFEEANNFMRPIALGVTMSSPWAAVRECVLPEATRPAECSSLTGIEDRYGIEIVEPMRAYLTENDKRCGEVFSCRKLQEITGEPITESGVIKTNQALVSEAPNFLDACNRLGRRSDANCGCLLEELVAEKGEQVIAPLEALYTRHLDRLKLFDETFEPQPAVVPTTAEQEIEDALIDAQPVCEAKGL